MPKITKTQTLYNVRLGRDKIRQIKVIAIKEGKTISQVYDRLTNLALAAFKKHGTIFDKENG